MQAGVSIDAAGDSFLEQVQANIPVPVSWKDGKHIASRLLTPEENIKLFEILGNKRRALATTVVQMLLAAPKNSNSWTEKLLGVLCLVKDFLKKSYFICLVDVSGENGIIQEQEIYKQFKYKKVLDTFHTFEGDHCTIGLNFCDIDEAAFFYQCVNERTPIFKRKRQAKKAKQERKADNLDQAPPSAGMVSKSSKHGSDRGTPKTKSKKGSLWSKVLRNPAKKYGPKAATRPEDTTQNVKASVASLSSEAGANGGMGNLAHENRHCSKLGRRDATGTENGASQSIPDSTPKDVGTRLCPSPEGVPNGRFYKSIISKSKYERQQLRYNKTAAKLKEHQQEYHSAMIRSLVSSRDTKAKQIKQQRRSNQGSTEGTTRKDRKSGISEANSLSPVKNSHIKSTHSARSSGVECFISGSRTSKSGTALYSSSQHRFKGSARSFSGISGYGISDSKGRNTNFKRIFTAWRRKSSDRLKLERTSSASIDLPLNLTARNSTSSRGSNSSFPSLPSHEKLQLPRSRHALHLMEGNNSFLQISQFPLSPRPSKTSGEIVPSTHEMDLSHSQSISGDSKSGSIDLRESLMKSIIAGKKLRKVSPKARDLKMQLHTEGTMLSEAIARAVQERSKFLRNSSDEEDNNDEEEEEDWFDDNEFEDQEWVN